MRAGGRDHLRALHLTDSDDYDGWERLPSGANPLILGVLSPVDYGILAVFVGALAAVALYFRGSARSPADYFFARRSLRWLPAGSSLVVALLPAFTLVALPADAYEYGLKSWIIPAALWLAMPLLISLVIPIYRGLELSSPYEYLELRFDARLRLAGAILGSITRLALVSLLVFFPCQALVIAAGWTIPAWPLVVVVGLVATFLAVIGGTQGIGWTSILHTVVMLLAAATVIVAVWLQVESGPPRVAHVANALGRMEAYDIEAPWSEPWLLWTAAAFWFLAGLMLLITDQTCVQRLLAARSVNEARTSYFAGCLALTFLLPGLAYAGLCLLTFYYDHPAAMRPEWVVNLDGETREPIRGPDGQPLLEPGNPAHLVTWENIDQLVKERRILHPNNKEPFTDPADLVDPASNRVLVERLAMRRPQPGTLRGEVIVRRDAPREMLPAFVADHVGIGGTGLVLAGLFASCLGGFSAALNSLATVFIVDIHRRFGFARKWLAARLAKGTTQLTPADETVLARPVTAALGLAMTLLALASIWLRSPVDLALALVSVCGGPLLAVYLLGFLSPRTTNPGAMWGLTLGCLCSLATVIARFPLVQETIPPSGSLPITAPLLTGFAAALMSGYLLSFALGTRKSNAELRGLVAGYGTPGLRSTDEPWQIIELPTGSERWK